MADRPTGPVKPPVIDLTARSSAPRDGEAKPDAKTSAMPDTETTARPQTTPRPETPPRPRVDQFDWLQLGLAAVGGAVLGTILTYLLATTLPLPSNIKPAPDLTTEVNMQGDKLNAMASDVAALKQSTTNTQVSLDATIAQLDAGLAEVKKSIADVKAAIPEAQPAVDLSPIETELRTLKTQVDAIAAGASGGDAGAMAQSLARLETGLSSLTTRLNGLDSTVSSLRTDLDAARQTLTDHINAALPNEAGPALKLPLILSGLESAFAAGKPFSLELESLATVVPDLAVPDALKAAANTRPHPPRCPDRQIPRYAARHPCRARNQQRRLDAEHARLGQVAARPATRRGNGGRQPRSRCVAARGRHGPPRLRRRRRAARPVARPDAIAAAPVAADISAHADADQLVTALRARALAPAEAAS